MVFEEQGEEVVDSLNSLHGDVQGVAWEEEGGMMYLVVERLEEMNQVVWILYFVDHDDEEGGTFQQVLELLSPDIPNWETPNPRYTY
jgi:hypothetical protein